jgi:hypothetical protein
MSFRTPRSGAPPPPTRSARALLADGAAWVERLLWAFPSLPAALVHQVHEGAAAELAGLGIPSADVEALAATSLLDLGLGAGVEACLRARRDGRPRAPAERDALAAGDVGAALAAAAAEEAAAEEEGAEAGAEAAAALRAARAPPVVVKLVWGAWKSVRALPARGGGCGGGGDAAAAAPLAQPEAPPLAPAAAALAAALPCNCAPPRAGGALAPGPHARACGEALYAAARAEAGALSRQRAALLAQAAAAHGGGGRGAAAAAGVYAERAAALGAAMRAANELASHALLLAKSPALRGAEPTGLREAIAARAAEEAAPTVDLHGQHGAEAVALLRDVVLPNAAASGARVIRCVTGNGARVVRDAVDRLLRSDAGRAAGVAGFEEDGPGAFLVRLKGRAGR